MAWELLTHPTITLFRAALLAGVAVATLCSLFSVIVVLKRMAFASEGIAHAGYGGVGTAVILGLAGGSDDLVMNVVVLAFCLVVGLGIGVLSRRRHLEPDSAIGILLVAAMAWGVLMSDLRRYLQNSPWYIEHILRGHPQTPPSAESLLFGSITTAGYSNAWLAVCVSAAVILIGLAFFKEILFYIFDESASRVFGVRATFIHYLLTVLLSITIVMAVRLAGFVLVGALLVIPGATALQVSRRLVPAFAVSWLVGMVGMVGGFLLSLQVGQVSSGACIVLILCAVFGMVSGVQALRRRLPRRVEA